MVTWMLTGPFKGGRTADENAKSSEFDCNVSVILQFLSKYFENSHLHIVHIIN